MKWLSRLRLPKSFRAPIRRARAKKESTARLLFAQQPNPAGRQKKGGKSVRWLGLDGRLLWGCGRVRRRSLLFPSFCSVPFLQARTFLPLFLHWQTETLTKIHTQTNHLEPPPPRGKVIRGCSTLHTHTHSRTHRISSAITFCQSQQQNRRSRKKKKGWKKKSID